MQTNNHKIEDYDTILDSRYGAEGTDSRKAFEEEARAFYACLLYTSDAADE